jgi:hypothetical protein
MSESIDFDFSAIFVGKKNYFQELAAIISAPANIADSLQICKMLAGTFCFRWPS